MSTVIDEPARKLFGEDRFARYLQDAQGDVVKAIELARWNQEFAGALHTQIGYVELAVRNAIDVQLRTLSLAEGGTGDWTNQGHVPSEVHALLSETLRTARRNAQKDANNRALRNSHRSGSEVLHADVVSQLMWGAWVKLIGDDERSEDTHIQRELWQDCLNSAFPNGPNGEAGRIKLSRQLCYLQGVRNAEAHFDNLFGAATNINRILNTCYSVLNSIGPDMRQGWLNPGPLRKQARELKEMLAS